MIVVEGYEADRDQETPEHPEQTEQGLTDPAGTGSEEDQGETDPEEAEQEGTESEGSEADPEEDQEEETGEDQEETEGDGTDESLEGEISEDSEEGAQEETETVSGNDIVIKGDVVVFPEGYEPVMSEVESALEDTEAIVKAIETQNDIIKAGSACTVFMLGVLAGAMIIAGFRLRRV